MGRYSGKSCRIVCMLVLTTTFLLVEIIVGHMSKSLALIADAFHMLSDTMALLVGLVAVKLARRARTKYNTYGWARAEVVGALINSVFLVALTFTIFVEAVERLAMREAIEDAYLLLYVGGAGLAINLVGLLLFHNHAHGHTHGGVSHGHSHGNHQRRERNTANDNQEETKISADVASDTESEGNTSSLVTNSDEITDENSRMRRAKSHQLNMRGVFIHVLGDALGSVVVMISATVTILARKFLNVCDTHHHHSRHQHQHNMSTGNHSGALDCRPNDPGWVLCIDPILSLVLVVIILCTALPLLKQTALVLMQTVPRHLELSEMHSCIEQIEGVVSIHEFHVWNLSSDKVIASLHVHTKCLDDYLSAAQGIKLYLHEEGIHSVTIQPEFPHLQSQGNGRVCLLECGPDMDCHKHTCCGGELSKAEDSCRCRSNGANRNPV